MNCDDCRQLMADLLCNETAAEVATELKGHVAECPACRAELEALSAVWDRLGILPDEHPGPGLRRRFYGVLSAETGPARPDTVPAIPHSRRWLQAAAAAALLACGWLLGFASGFPSRRAVISAMERELETTRQAAALSQIRQQGAADRLIGLAWCRQVSAPLPELLEAILERLNEDSSTNVRLAAVDTLMHFARRPEIRAGLIGALRNQEDPLVQLALIEAFTLLRDPQAVAPLQGLLHAPFLNPAVDKEAHASLQLLGKM